MNKKLVYFFGNGKAEGSAKMKLILGGKGANLAEMTNLGVPVPAGFTITTKVCKYFYENKKYPQGLEKEIKIALSKLEKAMAKNFGNEKDPLLVSVRSGAAVSMPGMMDTILNLGLTEKTVRAVAKRIDNPRFIWDAYRRLIQMFGNVVDGIEGEKFEHILEKIKKEKGVKKDVDLSANDLEKLVEEYREIYKKEIGKPFPDDPEVQLNRAIEAVFKSWSNPRAETYRRLNGIDGKTVFGTAVNVQAMVFGNMGSDCGTGVAFTRDPSTGEKKRYGEYLMNAQGEDVVAGIRTPIHLDQLEKENKEVYQQLLDIFDKLEAHYKDMQDIEFTIESGKLYILQTRTGKRTAAAAVKIAVSLVEEGIIDKKTALLKVEPNQLNQLLLPSLDPKKRGDCKIIANGLPASPGAASGEVVFSADAAVEAKEEGRKVVLVRLETSPEDIAGMNAAEGILTARGGMTSHAAVVARGMGKCCVAGCEDLAVSEKAGFFQAGEVTVKAGEIITLDGSTGEVFLGQVPTISPELSGDFATLMNWADCQRKLGVRTNADTPKDAKTARDLGAEGIGLCRTEHMFFEEDRIFAFRQMILSDTKKQREKALEKIYPMQKDDFKTLFEIMKGLPVKIRLLDPPLHEFLPKEEKDFEALAKEMNKDISEVKAKAESLHEFNPMMGHRGCRLGITFPEIYIMQAKAIINAALELKTEKGQTVEPEIMIPLVGHVNELKTLKEILLKEIEKIFKDKKTKVKYQIGTMIEVPRAAITAGEIASQADFFSFGTNDLTQMTFGFSRDDSGKFTKDYLEKEILKSDPFKTIDQEGVGQLVKWAIEKGREKNKSLHIGICGEHGGDPETVEFCHREKLNYVSCSPFRVPVARLAAAQAVIKDKLKL
jgi:pyruvate, orthophosphate dikinase